MFFNNHEVLEAWECKDIRGAQVSPLEGFEGRKKQVVSGSSLAFAPREVSA